MMGASHVCRPSCVVGFPEGNAAIFIFAFSIKSLPLSIICINFA